MRLRSRSGSRRRLLLRQLPGSPELPRFRRAHVRRRRERGSRRAERGEASRKNSSLRPFPHPSFWYLRPGPLFLCNAWCARPHKLAVCLARVAAETRARRPTLSPHPARAAPSPAARAQRPALRKVRRPRSDAPVPRADACSLCASRGRGRSRGTWSTWSAVISLTSRAEELRSAPSGPDDRDRVAGKRALAPGVRVRRERALK